MTSFIRIVYVSARPCDAVGSIPVKLLAATCDQQRILLYTYPKLTVNKIKKNDCAVQILLKETPIFGQRLEEHRSAKAESGIGRRGMCSI
jgi:hypothetical protein